MKRISTLFFVLSTLFIGQTAALTTCYPSFANALAHHSIIFYATAVEIEPVIGLV